MKFIIKKTIEIKQITIAFFLLEKIILIVDPSHQHKKCMMQMAAKYGAHSVK